MATNRTIYNNQLLYVGPAPASGYHFADVNGVPTFFGVNNLIQPLKRVNSFSYKIDTYVTRASEIGSASNIYDYNLQAPVVSINFDYNIKDLRNEARMGFYVKLSPSNLDLLDGGQVYPSGNILSGFSFSDQNYPYNSNLSQATNATFGYPYKYRDKRNLFLTINPNPDDSIGNSGSGFNVLAFGNCYINSYKISARVNDFPKASVGYVADNVVFYSSGTSGISPYVEPKSGLMNSGVRFTIPSYNSAVEENGNTISVLLPGDMTIDIFSANTTNKSGQSIILQDAGIQAFDINLPLTRDNLNNLGYELAIDRQLGTPITVDMSFAAIYKNLMASGNIIDLIGKESKYDIAIKLNKNNITLVRYDLRGAKLKDYSYDSAIGSNANINFSFYCDMDLTYPSSRGLYMSGLMSGFSYTNFATNGPF